jgi:integrase
MIAEQMKAEIESNLERGVAGLPQSFVDYYRVYEEFKRAVILLKSKSQAKRMHQQLKPFMLYLQSHKFNNLARIGTSHIEAHLQERSKTLSPKSWNDELNIIQRYFRFAVDREYLTHSPATQIGRQRVPIHSVEVYTPMELALIFKHANKGSADFYKALLYTGMRDGEARHLQWKDVVLTPGGEHIKIRSNEVHLTKNRRDRAVPLCPAAIALFHRLKNRRRGESPFVFPGRSGGPRSNNRNAWISCLRRIERKEGVRIAKGDHMTGMHLFRHTYATNALASGIDIRVVQQWLGHASILQTQRYTNLLPGQLQAQARRLEIPIGEET